jgi:hypothetical protein
MPDLIYDASDNALWIFVLVTLAMGGGAAFVSGRAIAQTWRPYWQLPLYMLPLAATIRFCHFALFGEPLLSLKSLGVDFVIACAVASLGFRTVRAGQMTSQYGWLFQRRGVLGWRRIEAQAEHGRKSA